MDAVVFSTMYGCVLRNRKHPLFLDMVITHGHHDLQVVLDDLYQRVSRIIPDFQIVINYGQFMNYYKTRVQIKLRSVDQIQLFMDPQPFEEGEEFEIILDSSSH